MKKRKILSYEDLRVLVALADGRGHPLWELPYMIMDDSHNVSRDLKSEDRLAAHKALMQIDQGIKSRNLSRIRKEVDISQLEKILTMKNEGKLSSRIKRLISEGWISRDTKKRIRPNRWGPRPSGPKNEYPLYLTEDRYGIIEAILHDELKVLRKKIKLMETEVLQWAIVKSCNGTTKKIIMPVPITPWTSKEYKQLQAEFWSYVWLFWRWRHRVKIMQRNKDLSKAKAENM